MNSPHTTSAKPNRPGDKLHSHSHSHSHLLVDFPARSRSRYQADKQVRFASHIEVQPVTSVLAVCSKQELWYSRGSVGMMRREMNRDARALALTLLSPSAKDLEEGIDVSEVVGLEKLVNPLQRRRVQKTSILQRLAVVSLQEDVQDEELRRISESYSSASITRARTLAVHWMGMDAKNAK